MDHSTDLSSGAASRRTFLASAGLAGAGLAGAAVGAGVLAGPAGAEPDGRTYTGGRFALDLDGKKAGALLGGGGGQAQGVVVEEAVGPDHIAHKHIGGVKYEDIKVVCGTGMSKEFYQWIKASFDRKYDRHSGRLTTWESDGAQPDACRFFDALITEVAFPALDGASKDAAKMTIKIRPETTQRAKAGPRQTLGTKQKQWTCNNYRLKIDGIDCRHVSKIDAIAIKQAFAPPPPPPGPGKTATIEPTKLEFPNLKIIISESYSNPLYDWYEDFVLNGNAKDERSGELTFLRADGHDLFTLTFEGLGIWIVDALPPTADGIRRVQAEMYCEQMSFRAHPAALD